MRIVGVVVWLTLHFVDINIKSWLGTGLYCGP